MEQDAFVNLTPDTVDREPVCCIIRRGAHPGIDAKRAWLAARLPEGHVFRRHRDEDCVMIEYAPLETAWVPIVGDNFDYIYCLWVQGAPKGKGYGTALMEYCLADARAHGRSGVCMLGADKQKAWLSDQRFAMRFGFCPVDRTPDGYTLLSLSFDGTQPAFTPAARQGTIPEKEPTVYYDDQCPFTAGRIEKLRAFCEEAHMSVRLIHVESREQAKALPCVFNNFAVLCGGHLVTVNQIDGPALLKIISHASP